MRTYKCHKTVQAGKITKIERNPHCAWISLETHQIQCVSPEWMQKHKPHIGGYYVKYSNDYTSFFPAEPFENGYTLDVNT